MKFILLYLLIINAAAVLSMLADKLRAKKNQWRIPERRLFLLAFLGGSPGILLGMYLFRHKTQTPKFTMGIPLILALQVVTATWILIFT